MKTTLANAEEIPERDLRFLWFEAYYDVVLSRFLIWRDRLCYFSICDDAEEEARCFSVHGLSDEEAVSARRAYEEVRCCFGDHCDLGRDPAHAKRRPRVPTDEESARYEASRNEPDVRYDQNPTIGWFRSSQL